MKIIVEHIINKEYDAANQALSEAMSTIAERKICEMKKAIAAKLPNPEFVSTENQKKVDNGVMEATRHVWGSIKKAYSARKLLGDKEDVDPFPLSQKTKDALKSEKEESEKKKKKPINEISDEKKWKYVKKATVEHDKLKDDRKSGKGGNERKEVNRYIGITKAFKSKTSGMK